MSMRIVFSAVACLALAACSAPTGTTAPAGGGQDFSNVLRTDPLPRVLRVVGSPGPGAEVLRGMQRDGINATGSFQGREAGLRAFCTGAAEALALTSDLSQAERDRCFAQSRANNVAWSAIVPPRGSDVPILYMRFRYANAFFEESSVYD